MGYHTYFTLSVIGANRTDQERIREMLANLGVLGYALQEESGTEYGAKDPVKWSGCDGDMLEVSREFPQVLFSIHGEGDNNGDIWESHYLGGKTYTQPAIITIPPFNPALLKEPEN